MNIQGIFSDRHENELEFAERTPFNGNESFNSVYGPTLPPSYLPGLDDPAQVYEVTGCYEEDELRPPGNLFNRNQKNGKNYSQVQCRKRFLQKEEQYQRRKSRSLRKIQTLHDEWSPSHFGGIESSSAEDLLNLNRQKQVKDQEVQMTDRGPQSMYKNGKVLEHQDELHPNPQHTYAGSDQAHAKAAERQAEPNLDTKVAHSSRKFPGSRHHLFNKHKVYVVFTFLYFT